VWEYGIVCQAIDLPAEIEHLEQHAIVEEVLEKLTAAVGYAEEFTHNPPASICGPVELLSHQLIQIGPARVLTVMFKYRSAPDDCCSAT
jgi:hypothetical protein